MAKETTKEYILGNRVLLTLKRKPWWLYFVSTRFAISCYPYIYVPKKVFETPEKYELLLWHEFVHLRQQKLVGPCKFHLKYVFIKSFRYRSELAAFAEEIRRLPASVQENRISMVANALASFEYGWVATTEQARIDLLEKVNNEY